MLDFGKAFNYWIDQTHLANEGARWAAVNKNPGGGTLQEYDPAARPNTGGAPRAAAPPRCPTPLQVCISFPNGTRQVGDPVQRDGERLRTTGFPSSAIGSAITSTSISASSTMRLEAVPTNYSAGCA